MVLTHTHITMQQQSKDTVNNKVLIKDLPLYNETEQTKSVYVALVRQPNDFELGVSEVRKEVFGFIDLFAEQRKRAIEFYKCVVYHTRTSADYVHNETNILPKLAIITGSGLTGILLGIRRSNFRRFMNSVTLMGASTALCYPSEAKTYGGHAFDWTRVRAQSIYNDYIMPSNKQQTVINIDSKDKILTYKPSEVENSTSDFVGDKGQSKDEDAGFYTTRK